MDYIQATLLPDPNTESKTNEIETKKRKPRTLIAKQPLSKFYYENPQIIEIGLDEVGRGPLFGRVYAAAAILPKDDSFDHSRMKDSKKFHSKKKIDEAAEYIKQNAIAWSIQWEDEKTIDEINILQATQKCMHKCIQDLLKKLQTNNQIIDINQDIDISNIRLIVDGNYFKTFTQYNQKKKQIQQIEHVCVEGGDNKYSAIAAASILAKVARDEYIDKLCKEYPDLITKYSIDSNKGYGAAKHIAGIKEHGITIWHRRTFGICSSTFEKP